MKYAELIEHMHKYRAREISADEMNCAFHMWQRGAYPEYWS